MGPAKKSHKYTEHEKKVVAYHEAGHAVMGIKLDGANEVQKITIVPRGAAGGYNLMLPKEETYLSTKKELLETIQNKKHIIIVNKTDLETKIDLKDENYIRMSTINNIGIKELKERIIKLFELDKIEQSDMTYLTNARSIALLKQVKEKIEEIENSINMNIPISIIEIDLRNVWEILGKIIGEHYEDELIDQLFTQFCLGK